MDNSRYHELPSCCGSSSISPTIINAKARTKHACSPAGLVGNSSGRDTDVLLRLCCLFCMIDARPAMRCITSVSPTVCDWHRLARTCQRLTHFITYFVLPAPFKIMSGTMFGLQGAIPMQHNRGASGMDPNQNDHSDLHPSFDPAQQDPHSLDQVHVFPACALSEQFFTCLYGCLFYSFVIPWNTLGIACPAVLGCHILARVACHLDKYMDVCSRCQSRGSASQLVNPGSRYQVLTRPLDISGSPAVGHNTAAGLPVLYCLKY